MTSGFEKSGTVLTVHLPAELDHPASDEIRRDSDRIIGHEYVKNMIFDFSETVFMDSSGIGLVLGRVRKIHPINGKVYLFGGNELIQKMWEMAGILNLVTVLDSIEKVKEVYE